MPDLVGIADVAKRLRLDFTTVRRLIAKEKDALQITLRRGKGDKLFLAREDAEKLIASYEARRAVSKLRRRNRIPLPMIGMATST